MNETSISLSVMTCILIKKFKNIELSSFDMEYVSGVLEGFNEADEKEQEYMLFFTDILEAQNMKQKGKLN